jgi:hypothetical protein
MAATGPMDGFFKLLRGLGVIAPENLRADYGNEMKLVPTDQTSPVVLVHGSGRPDTNWSSKMTEAIRSCMKTNPRIVVLVMVPRITDWKLQDVQEQLKTKVLGSEQDLGRVDVFFVTYQSRNINPNKTDVEKIIVALRTLTEGIDPIKPTEDAISQLNIEELSAEQREKLRVLLDGVRSKLG